MCVAPRGRAFPARPHSHGSAERTVIRPSHSGKGTCPSLHTVGIGAIPRPAQGSALVAQLPATCRWKSASGYSENNDTNAFRRFSHRRLRRGNFRIAKREQSFARSTHVLRWGANAADGEDSRFVAPCAGGCGGAGIGVGWHGKVLRGYSYPGGFQLKGSVAIVANMVVATRRIAGIMHVGGTAMRAGHGNRRKRHGVPNQVTGER